MIESKVYSTKSQLYLLHNDLIDILILNVQHVPYLLLLKFSAITEQLGLEMNLEIQMLA